MTENARLRAALEQIAVLVEYGTTGPNTEPRCKSAALTADQATSLRGAVSEIAREALAAPADAVGEAEREVIEAAKAFVHSGTRLTVCDRGPCQQVVEHKDRSDPHFKLCEAESTLAKRGRS